MADNSTSNAQAFADEARLFVIRLTGTYGQVLGYAVAERLSFFDPAAAVGNFAGLAAGAKSLEHAFQALRDAQAAEGVTADAAALPASLDPGGRGLTIGAPSATRGAPSATRGAPSGPPSAESTRGAPSGPPSAESTRGAPSGPPSAESTRGAPSGPPKAKK